MNPDQSEITKILCQRLAIAFLNHIDHQEFKEAAALFSPDAVWLRLNDQLVGPDQIYMTISGRPATQRERHIATNIHITISDSGTVRALAYVVTFRTNAAPTAGVVSIPGANGLADFHYEFKKVSEEWKISRLSSKPVFVFKP